MSILRTVPEGEADGLVKELYDQDVASLGYVPPHTRAMALNPEAVRAFENLIRACVAQMDTRRYELVTLAAASALGSDACRAAHARKSLTVMDEQTVVRALGTPGVDDGFTDAEVAMMDFARRLSADSASMTDEDSERLREVGFSDRGILDIALVAGARNFYSRTLHALAVEVDVPPDLPPAVRAAL